MRRKANHNRLNPMPADPILRRVFEHIDRKQMTYGWVERRAGINEGQLRRWRLESVRPRLDLIEAVVTAVGLRLEVVSV